MNAIRRPYQIVQRTLVGYMAGPNDTTNRVLSTFGTEHAAAQRYESMQAKGVPGRYELRMGRQVLRSYSYD